MISFPVSCAVTWKGEAVGVSEGVALWGHYRQAFRKFSFIHQRPIGSGTIPGFSFIGFHYYVSGHGLRLIGIPLWFPAAACLVALLISIRSWEL